MSESVLKLILFITVGAPDVAAIEQAYARELDYRVVEQGEVSRELAEVWNAPRMAGRRFSLMQPASGADIYLRFVEMAVPADYVPMGSFGWNAIEILVQDPDAIAARMRTVPSAFRIIGEPRPLGPNSPIRAMQVVGPAKEVLYLTRIPPEQGRPGATTPIDRPFIMIVGGPDIDKLRGFYAETFGLSVSTPVRARMTVLNKAHGLDIETTHPLAMARLSPEYAIEIDGYPPAATARRAAQGELPPAIATVGFAVNSLDALRVEFLAPPRTVKAMPYRGRRVGVARGPAGELLELVETP